MKKLIFIFAICLASFEATAQIQISVRRLYVDTVRSLTPSQSVFVDDTTLSYLYHIMGVTKDSSVSALGGHFRGLLVDDNVSIGGSVTAFNFSGSSSGTNTGDVTLAGTPDYIAISGQVITRGLIDLTTDVTGDLPYANITQASAASRLLGRGSAAGAGDWQEVTVGTGLSMSGTALTSTITQYTDEQAQDAVGAMVDASLVYVDATPLLTRAALTGDVTAPQGSNSTTIANDAVTYAKIQNVTDARLLGRSAGSAGDVQEITIGSGLSLSAGQLSATGGSGITSLNGLTAASQTFADVDDTNVTLAIGSVTSTHTFTLGWTGILASARGGTANAFFTVAGPATSAKTYTFPNSSTNVLTEASAGWIMATATANYNFNNGTLLAVNSVTINDPGEGYEWGGNTAGTITGAVIDDASDNILQLSVASATSHELRLTHTGGGSWSMTINGNAVWNAGNDGAGSGLDADLLDGNSSAAFQLAGNYITALTGNVTATGPGSVVATIANDAVTYAKMQNVSVTNRVLGRVTAGAGDVEELSTIPSAVLGGSSLFVGTTSIALNRASASQALTGITSIDGSAATLTTTRNIAMTGDVTWNVNFNGSGNVTAAGTIANDAVTLAKMANVATSTVFYRKTAATGDPEVQTLATLKTDLLLTGTNSGDITLAAVGAVPNANAASLSGQVLNLQPANATNPGVLTAGTQAVGGIKTFADTTIFSDDIAFSKSSNLIRTNWTGSDLMITPDNSFSTVGIAMFGSTDILNTGAINYHATNHSFYDGGGGGNRVFIDNGNLGLSTLVFGSSAVGVLGIGNGTVPTTSPANIIQLYAQDVSASSELKVRNEAGQITTLSGNASFPGTITVGAAGGNISWGTYTPTATHVTNVAATSPGVAQWMRVGNTVTVSGYIDIDPTSAATGCEFRLTLPVASNFTNIVECAGVIAAYALTQSGLVFADATNNEARIMFLANTAANQTHNYTYTYRIL